MMMPLGPMPNVFEEPVPDVVKDYHRPLWLALSAIYIVVGVFMSIACDVMSAIFCFVLGLLVLYISYDRCKNMNMCFLMMFGILLCVEFIFEIVTLCQMAGGRSVSTTTTTTATLSDGVQQTTDLTTTSTHAFFEPSMGFVYNLQSAVTIVSPVCMLCGAVLAYKSYNAYSHGIMGPPEEDIEEPFAAHRRPVGGRFRAGGGGAGAGGGGGGGVRIVGGRVVQPGEQQESQRPRLFEGQGQKLGS